MKNLYCFALCCSMGFALSAPASADIAFPDLTMGGTFDLEADCVTTVPNQTNIADDALAVLNIDGTLNATGNTEVQFGGVNGQLDNMGNIADDLNQDVTLDIGSTGVVNLSSAWFAFGWPGNADDPVSGGGLINFDPGATLTVDGTGFGVRSKGTDFGGGGSFTASGTGGGGGQNGLTLFTYLYDNGLVQFDGGNEGTFAENFTFTADPTVANAFTLVANASVVPEPSSIALLGLGAIGMITRRRK